MIMVQGVNQQVPNQSFDENRSFEEGKTSLHVDPHKRRKMFLFPQPVVSRVDVSVGGITALVGTLTHFGEVVCSQLGWDVSPR